MNDNFFRVLVVVLLVAITGIEAMRLIHEKQHAITQEDLMAVKGKDRTELAKQIPLVRINGSVDANIAEPMHVVIEEPCVEVQSAIDGTINCIPK